MSVSEPRTLSERLFQSLGVKYEKTLPSLVDFAILVLREGMDIIYILSIRYCLSIPVLTDTVTGTSLGPITQALFLPLLRWWHTALYLFSTRWSNGSSTDLRLPGRHLGMDERTSPTAQPGKHWASCLPCHSNYSMTSRSSKVSQQFINFGQKSWCNLWWPADL